MSERERYTKKLCLSSLSVVVYWCSVDDVNDVLFFFLSLSLSRCATVGAGVLVLVVVVDVRASRCWCVHESFVESGTYALCVCVHKANE